MPQNPVYILNIGGTFRLRVSLTHRQLLLPISEVTGVQIVTPEGEEYELETMLEFANQATCEMVALLALDSYKSQRLAQVSPYCGDVHTKYTTFDVIVSVLMAGSPDHTLRLRTKIFCRMIRRERQQWRRKCLREVRKLYSCMPQSAKKVVKWSLFAANIGLAAVPVTVEFAPMCMPKSALEL